MWGSATFATLVSSTSMKVASITTPAIIHGLMAGFSRGKVSITFACIASPGRSFGEDRGARVHSRTQNGVASRNSIQHDLHRNALHDLHIISSGVFRRQQ